MNTPREAADGYERFIRRTGLSDASKDVYVLRVRSFLEWLEAQGPEYADALKDEWVRDYAAKQYVRKLLTVDKRAPATVAQHLSAISSFYGDWLELGKPRGVSIEVPPSQKKGLTEDELRKVLRACQRRGVRDFALAQVIFQSGVRVDECHALDTDDVLITERTGQLHVRYGKGGKPRTLPLSVQGRDALRAWLDERKTARGADGPAMFLSSRGERLAVRSIQDVMQKAGQSAGVRVSPHVLRHTFGRRSVEQGTDLEALRQLMGHKSIQTTAGYTRPRWENLEDAVERVAIDL